MLVLSAAGRCGERRDRSRRSARALAPPVPGTAHTRRLSPAERTGLMRPLTRLVLDASSQQCLGPGGSEGWMWRSLSRSADAYLLDVALPDEVNGALHRYGVPYRLELEITENTILTDPCARDRACMFSSALGASSAIDYFGVGYSSLGYLKRLSVYVLKIDRSLRDQHVADDNDESSCARRSIWGTTSARGSWRRVSRDAERCRRLGELMRRCPGLMTWVGPRLAAGLDALPRIRPPAGLLLGSGRRRDRSATKGLGGPRTGHRKAAP